MRGLTGNARIFSLVALNIGSVTAFARTPSDQIRAGQRFVFAVFSTHLSRSQRSAHHVCDCAENGAHDRGSKWSGGAPGESWLRGALGRTGRSPQSDGLYHAQRVGPGAPDSRGNGREP